MNLHNVTLETPLVLEKSAFTSTAFLFLQRQVSCDEKRHTICHWPEETFRPNYDRIRQTLPSKAELSLCVICRYDVKYSSQKKVLECHHIFHSKCIKQWFAFQHSCPVCRVEIL